MPFSFPVALSDFFVDLALVSITFAPMSAGRMLTTGGGETISADVGARLWRGTCTLAIGNHVNAEAAAAKVRMLDQPHASFFITPPHMSRVGAATADLTAVQNGREVRLTLNEAGQTLPAGSFLSFAYGTDPVRYALHQMTEDAISDGQGLTGWSEVFPAVRPGYALDAEVNLARPQCKAKIIRGSVADLSVRAIVADGLSFAWVQTLR